MIVLLILFKKKTCSHADKFFFSLHVHTKHTKSVNFKYKQIYGNFLPNKGHLLVRWYFKLHHQKPTATYLPLLTKGQLAEFSVVLGILIGTPLNF